MRIFNRSNGTNLVQIKLGIRSLRPIQRMSTVLGYLNFCGVIISCELDVFIPKTFTYVRTTLENVGDVGCFALSVLNRN